MIHRRTVFSLLLFLLLAQPSFAQEETAPQSRWRPPLFIKSGWFPSVSVDATGTAHLVWADSPVFDSANDDDAPNASVDNFMYMTRSRDGEMSTPIDVIMAAEGGYTIRNAIDIDSKGIIHTYFRSYLSHDYIQAPTNDAYGAPRWINRTSIDSGYYLDLLVDTQDVIHVVSSAQSANLATLGIDDTDQQALSALTERFPCAFCADLMYYRSVDGGKTWSSRVNISQTIEGSEKPEFVEGASGRIYLSWSEGFDWYISRGEAVDGRFIYSDDQGETWSDPVILDGGDDPILGRPKQLSLTEMANGDIMVVWHYSSGIDAGIYYQISDDSGQTWTEPQAIPNIRGSFFDLDRYALITDLQGIVHLFAVGFDEQTNTGPALYHLEYRQGRWLRPVRIYYDPEVDRPNWPQVDIGPTNDLHLIWFVYVGNGETAADVGDLKIFYTNRPGNMSDEPVLAAYAPTAIPVVSPTVVPTFAPTATSFPTVAPMEANLKIDTANQDRYATETLLVAILAVGILCVGVLVIGGFRPRL